MQQLLHNLVEIERERVKLDKKFQQVLKKMQCLCLYAITKEKFKKEILIGQKG